MRPGPRPCAFDPASRVSPHPAVSTGLAQHAVTTQQVVAHEPDDLSLPASTAPSSPLSVGASQEKSSTSGGGAGLCRSKVPPGTIRLARPPQSMATSAIAWAAAALSPTHRK